MSAELKSCNGSAETAYEYDNKPFYAGYSLVNAQSLERLMLCNMKFLIIMGWAMIQQRQNQSV
ncbi:hypothetical protein ACTJKB_09275 [Paenibacillus sp. 22594]